MRLNCLLPLFILLPTAVLAQNGASLPSPQFEFREDQPVLLSADHMEYDQQTDSITASGHVEISQGETILLAKQVVYQQRQDIVTASGDVAVMEPSGNVYFAEQVELQEGMKRGVVDYFRARLADGSLVTAREGRKLSESVTQLEKAIYSPCAIFCRDGTPKKPTWALTASKVTIDTEAQEVSYDDAWMELYGVPVLYTPVFSHPTPGADNKSGLLSPMLRFDDNLGTTLQAPYYQVISQSADITLTPWFTSKEGPVLVSEYRQKFDRGNILIEASGTAPRDREVGGQLASGREFRGHVDGRGRYELDENWGTGFQLQRSTDDTYLTRYNFSRESLLTSRAYLEGVNFLNNGNRRHYAQVQALHFQGLTAQDDRRRTPVVFPLTEIGYTSEPLFWGSRLTGVGNIMSLLRTDGIDSRRAALALNWNLPHVTDGGHIFEVDAEMRADVYEVTDYVLTSGKEFNGTKGRLTPQLGMTWRYPLINRLEESTVTVEPIVNLTLSPEGGNPEEIPNEDSAIPEFTDLNVFSMNRFSGWDRIERGSRMFYGFRSLWDFFDGKQIAATLGQAYRLGDKPQFPISNDLTTRFSDYVGRFALQYAPFNLTYRFRMDSSNYNLQRNELEAGMNFKRFGVSAAYLDFNNDPSIGNSEEIVGTTYLWLNENWMLSLLSRRDLELQRQTNTQVNLTYQNECLTLAFGVGRDLINDRDVQNSTSMFVRVFLKNLE